MLHDLRYALRSLSRSPGFTATALLTLTLGVGVVTAAFSVLNALFLRPLPGIPEADRLAVVRFEDTVLAGSPRAAAVTPARFAELSRDLTSVVGLAAYSGADLTVGAGDTAVAAHIEFVTPKYFTILGTSPQVGRLFTNEDDLPGSPASVAVIGHGIWTSLFHRDPMVVGKSLTVNTETFTVVGVAPAGFGGVSGPGSAALWIPSGTLPSVYRVFGEVVGFTPHLTYWQFVTGVSPGHSFEQAEAELDARGRHVLGKRLHAVRGAGLSSIFREQTVEAVRLILGVTAAVLLLACANVASLVLLRGLHQSGEAAMRKVLGAGVADLVRQRLLETLLLGVGGSILGLGFVRLVLGAFRGATLVRGAPALEAISIDHRVAVFTVAVSILAAVLSGLVSVPVALRVTPADAVRAGARVTARGRRSRNALTALQLGTSLALVVGTLLLVKTLRNLGRVELGFEPLGVGMVEVQPASVGYQGSRLQAYYLQLLDRLASLPGIDAVSLASRVPFSGTSAFTELTHRRADGGTVTQWTALATVSPDYFRTMRIPLVRGRSFTDEEFTRPGLHRSALVVVNQALARRLFGDADPIGRLVTYRGDPRPAQVIGVAADARWNTLLEPQAAWEGGPQVYQLFHASTSPGGPVAFKANGIPLGHALVTVRGAAIELDRSVPVSEARTLESNLAQYLGPRRLLLKTLGWLSALALGLAAVGLYGVVAYGVASRSKDLSIRIALGAPARRVHLLILREAAGLAGLGVIIGIPLAVALGRAIAARLYGVTAVDPASLALAIAVLLAAALAAGWAPAQRAARIDPMTELRS